MNELPYPLVSPANPVLTVTVEGIDLTTVDGTGLTGLYVRRVGETEDYVMYPVLEERGQQLSFAFDYLLFDRPGGRYTGRLVYKGVDIAVIDFVYDRRRVNLVGTI